jgi:hypothetical protein
MTSLKISPEKYILPLGKYKGMYATDVVKIVVVDKKGNDKMDGLLYLEWLIQQHWFRDSEIIKKVIDNAKGKKPETEEESVPKKKKEPKKQTVQISSNIVDKTIEF